MGTAITVNEVDSLEQIDSMRRFESAGTVGGSATTGSWTVFAIDEVEAFWIEGATLSSNQITFPAGTYEIRVEAAFYHGDESKLRLRTTGGSTELEGISDYGCNGTAPAVMLGVVTFGSETTCEIQYYVTHTGGGTSGLGNDVNVGAEEVYLRIEITKL